MQFLVVSCCWLTTIFQVTWFERRRNLEPENVGCSKLEVVELEETGINPM
jgi:hypothetical protein